MLYSFSDSSWTGPGQDSIVVTVCAKQPAAGLGVVKHTTFSLPSPTPRSLVKGQLGYGQKSMRLGRSGRWWPSKEWGLAVSPSHEASCSRLLSQGGPKRPYWSQLSPAVVYRYLVLNALLH